MPKFLQILIGLIVTGPFMFGMAAQSPIFPVFQGSLYENNDFSTAFGLFLLFLAINFLVSKILFRVGLKIMAKTVLYTFPTLLYWAIVFKVTTSLELGGIFIFPLFVVVFPMVISAIYLVSRSINLFGENKPIIQQRQ